MVAACSNSSNIEMWRQIVLKAVILKYVADCVNSSNVEMWWQLVLRAVIMKCVGSMC